MTPAEFEAIRVSLGLSHTRIAKLLGTQQRTTRKWSAGEQDVQRSAAMFLRYLHQTGESGRRAFTVLGLKWGEG